MPKVKYSRELILVTAKQLVEKSGLGAINARDLAQELGCSVAPIYTAFGSLEQLIQAIIGSFIELIVEYSSKEYSKDNFLNIGIGLVRFATEHPKVYQSLFLEGISIDNETNGKLLEIMYNHPLKDWLDKEELTAMMRKMDIFTSGLCLEIVLGNNYNLTIEQCEKLLSDMGEEMIIGVLVKKGVYDKFKEQIVVACENK